MEKQKEKEGFIVFNGPFIRSVKTGTDMADAIMRLRPSDWVRVAKLPAELEKYTVRDGKLRKATEKELQARVDFENSVRLATEMNSLQSKLNATDYKAIKYAEGAYAEEEYEPIRAQRAQWRSRINEIRALITEIEKSK